MKRMKLLSLFLSLLLVLTSCGIVIINDGKNDPDGEGSLTSPNTVGTYLPPEYPLATETDGEAVALATLQTLPNYDFDGLSVFFAVAKEIGDVFNDESGIYVDAVTRRNQLVNEKYNTQLLITYRTAEELASEVGASDWSGEFYADFVVLRNGDLGAYAVSGRLRNLKALTHVDFSAPYYNATAMEQLTVGDVVYGAVGNATEQVEHYTCIYYNIDLGKELSLSLPYDAIYDGSFTWETLLTEMRKTPTETPIFASSMDDGLLSVYSYLGTSRTFLVPDGNKSLTTGYVTGQTEQLIAMLKLLLPLRSNKVTYEITVPATTGSEETIETVTAEGFDIFLKGRSLYAFGTVADMAKLKNAGFHWEILPFPKLNEEDGYASGVAYEAPILAVLDTSPNIDTIGYILEAIQAASYGYIAEAFDTDATKNCITGIHTLDMLDLIRENPIYDFSRMFGYHVDAALRQGTYEAYTEAVNGGSTLDYYASRKANALKNYLNGLL